jgi:hypothetical protein
MSGPSYIAAAYVLIPGQVWTLRGGGAYNALAMDLKNVDGIIEAALKEDIPAGDVTSESIIPADSVSVAVLMAKEDGVLGSWPASGSPGSCSRRSTPR